MLQVDNREQNNKQILDILEKIVVDWDIWMGQIMIIILAQKNKKIIVELKKA